LHQRYIDLNQTFADAWRVTNTTSLFDYAPGTSTSTFTYASWPPEKPPCLVPQTPVAKPLDSATAVSLCRNVKDKNLNANCVFDVTVTGEPGFANLFNLTQQIRAGATQTTLIDPKDPTKADEPMTFTAIVTARGLGKDVPAGTVQLYIDGEKAGAPAALDESGQAKWEIAKLGSGGHKLTASYAPNAGSVFLASSSFEEIHTVDR
jgi:hypothetical protein